MAIYLLGSFRIQNSLNKAFKAGQMGGKAKVQAKGKALAIACTKSYQSQKLSTGTGQRLPTVPCIGLRAWMHDDCSLPAHQPSPSVFVSLIIG